MITVHNRTVTARRGKGEVRMRLAETIWAWPVVCVVAGNVMGHGVGKLSDAQGFARNFNFDTTTIGYITGSVEVASSLGLLLGILAVTLGRWRGVLGAAYTARQLGRLSMILGAIGIVCVQIGAITVAHWPHWFFYEGKHDGMEYSVMIIVLCATIAMSSAVNMIREKNTVWGRG